jgi:hypothetical protein
VAREAGIRYPVALTRAAWERCVAVPLGDAFLPDPPGHRLDRLRRHRHVCQLLYQVAGPGAGAGQRPGVADLPPDRRAGLARIEARALGLRE